MSDLSRSQWYLGNASGEREGPFSSDVIVSMRLSRCIDDNTPCWRQGMGEWMPLGQVPALMDLIDFRKRLARRRIRNVIALVLVAVVGVGAGVFAFSRVMAPETAARTQRPGSKSSGEATFISPELKPLQRFVGSWKLQVVLKPAQWNPERKNTTGIAEHEWILDGRVLQCQSNSASGDFKGLVLMSYDAEKREYRQWFFDSIGTLPTDGDRGQWNETSKMFTWKGTDRWGNTSTSVTRFIDDDSYEWVLVTKDYTGRVLSDMEGKATRQ